MERVRLTAPGESRARGGRARLYVRWMPHLGAEAVALYELLRVLPDVGHDAVEPGELAELLRSTPESVAESFGALVEAGFVVEREGWMEVAEHPPAGKTRQAKRQSVQPENSPEAVPEVVAEAVPEAVPEVVSGAISEAADEPDEDSEQRSRALPARDVQVVRAEPEGVSADDYFKYMGTLPAPHILEFLNGYCERDGIAPDAVREALRIASERDARRVGYVRSILERWIERGVKTVEDVERFEQDRKLRLVEESGAVRGGALKMRQGVAGGGVRGGADRQSAARRREGYEWLFGEEG